MSKTTAIATTGRFEHCRYDEDWLDDWGDWWPIDAEDALAALADRYSPMHVEWLCVQMRKGREIEVWPTRKFRWVPLDGAA